MRCSGLEAKERSMPMSSTPTRRIPELAICEGKFLESILPIQAIATLTTPVNHSGEEMSLAFLDLVAEIQAHERFTVGWIRALEHSPREHIHAVFIAPARLDCSFAESIWRLRTAQRYSEAARVEPYQAGRVGFGYVVKTLDTEREDLIFSDNLPAFALNYSGSASRTTSAQRRQVRRIKRQLERDQTFRNVQG
jgi:hypothetical protein